MNLIVEGLILVGIILSFPVSIILFVNDKSIKSVTRLLAIAFFSISCYALSHFLFLTELILVVPSYYRFATPLYYLIPPCIYLYVTHILNQDDINLKLHWFHFVPAMVMVVDIVPWVAIGGVARYEAVEAIIANRRLIFSLAPGYLPVWIHFVARPLIGMLYIFYQFRYLYKEYLLQGKTIKIGYRGVITKWIITLTVIELILYLSVSGFSIAMFLNLDDDYLSKIVYVPAILMCISFIIIAFYLYLNPVLLYGSNFRTYELSYDSDQLCYDEADETMAQTFQDTIPSEKRLDQSCKIGSGSETGLFAGPGLSPYTKNAIEEYRRCLEHDLVHEELFKRQGLTVYQLTKMCDLPARALSFMLTHVYKKRFNDFINEYRINYVVQRLHDDDWRGLTLEGLALEAGFSSRTTFFLAFKKVHQMSPSQYLSNLEKQMYRMVKS